MTKPTWPSPAEVGIRPPAVVTAVPLAVLGRTAVVAVGVVPDAASLVVDPKGRTRTPNNNSNNRTTKTNPAEAVVVVGVPGLTTAVVAAGGRSRITPRRRGPVGGRLRLFHHKWRAITEDEWLLQTLRDGYRIEFTSPCPLTSVPFWTPAPDSPEERVALEAGIADLLSKHAIVAVDPTRVPPGFFSPMFLTPKKSGGFRPILNLKGLKPFVIPDKFRMETLASVKLAIGEAKLRRSLLGNLNDPLRETRGPWAVSLDLKDAYFHVAIHPEHTRYLRFGYDGITYEFVVLPFGLQTAPRTFTRVVRALGSYLRRQGVDIFMYLDDWLVLGETYEQAVRNRDLAYQWTVDLGFLVNAEKSEWEPTTRPVFIGAVLDLNRCIAYPSQERVGAMITSVQVVYARDSVPARTWLSVLGHMASLIELVPNVQYHMRVLQFMLRRQWTQATDSKSKRIFLTEEGKIALQWWLRKDNLVPGLPFTRPDPEVTVVTDASHWGWGGHMGDQGISGQWSTQDSIRHINWLELQAVFHTLKHFRSQVRGLAVEVHTDNTTVVAYINKQGGTVSWSLCHLALCLWDWCLEQRVSLSAIHLQGTRNVVADALSRGKAVPTEWMLHPAVVQALFLHWGTPYMDLFASEENHQLPLFFSRGPTPSSSGTNALAQDWSMLRAYAYPPISLINQVLRKLRRFPTSEILLIAPFWPSQVWFTGIKDLMVGLPIRLPDRPDLLQQPSTREFYPNPGSLHLTAWHLSANPSRREAFLERLLLRPPLLDGNRPDGFIMTVFTHTTSGLGTEIFLPLQPLW